VLPVAGLGDMILGGRGMIAREVAMALPNARRAGQDWRCQCPLHGGHSLTLADGRDGKLLVKCFGGCDWRDIFAELRSRGLIDGGPDINPEREAKLRRRREAETKAKIEKLRRGNSRARDLYRRGKPAARTLVEVYLRSRGYTDPVLPILRFLQFCPHRNGKYYPAMIAPIVNVAGEQIAIHKTFLKPDGTGKAALPKEEQRETCGPVKGGAVRLGPVRPGVPLTIGEGIESTLSAIQLWGCFSGWAALSANGLRDLALPPEAQLVRIAIDNDANGVGQAAARDAAWVWGNEGRTVRVALPPIPGTDFNDVLMGAH
jgi:hypothetical protein